MGSNPQLSTPLMSITIPTRNAASHLGSTISSIRDACSLPHEIIVADGGSMDETVAVASRLGVEVIPGQHLLLHARRIMADAARADIVVLVDADQITGKKSLDIAYKQIMSGAYDMVALGERVLNPRTVFARGSDADKILCGLNFQDHLDPYRGVILPRVFKRDLLLRALSDIPLEYDDFVVAQDHALIYEAAYRHSNRVFFLPNSIFHVEPDRLRDVWKKNFRYGMTSRMLTSFESDASLSKSKMHRLGFRQGSVRLKLWSYVFLLLKAPAWGCGMILGSFQLRFPRYFKIQ